MNNVAQSNVKYLKHGGTSKGSLEHYSKRHMVDAEIVTVSLEVH